MIKLISAGAGSGKTYRLTEEMVKLLRGGTRASGIIATTFTAKAAAELQERVRTKLLEEGLTEQANDLSNALIGTVHGLGVKLLRRFAFEAGVSPQVDIIAEEDTPIFFNRSLAQILTSERVERMNELCEKLGLTKKAGTYDWRKDIRQLVDVARGNAFDKTILEKSRDQSFTSFKAFLGEPVSISSVDYNTKIFDLLVQTIEALEGNGDATKVTADGVGELKTLRNDLRQRNSLHWHQWVKLTKIKVGAKSKDNLEDLMDYAQKHTQFIDFQEDIKQYIDNVFNIVIEAIAEYDHFKKQRGLIDYTDMEVLVRNLLATPSVFEVLEDELDLLMVDEFQDTSPIQLDMFFRLSKIAKHSIWVGDPKQSIYGFRGAEPRLMQAIIEHVGIKDEDILKDSWRSRPDIVAVTNALFTKSFDDLPAEQVALNAKRQNGAAQKDALMHWHFNFDDGGEGKKRQPGGGWVENCMAESLKVFLSRENLILPKGEKEYRAAQAGDIAILCRTNSQGQTLADALHRVGLKAAMARTGLLQTAESTLILAVLRYILNRHDSLAVAEILLLAERLELSEIIEDRLAFLEGIGEGVYDWKWSVENDFIKEINELRRDTTELSANEILNLVLEELDLRRIIAAWGKTSQRLDNVDVIRKFSLEYENACNRLHTAASLGGFMLWLANLGDREADKQSSGEGSDAVNILTYHRSKGLEYPVVILSNLENNLRDDVFGIAIESDTVDEGNPDSIGKGVDLDNILGNRWLRFWVNPYADQIKNTSLEEKINASEAKRKANLAALAEEARILYVGVTRARDYLIFPTSQTPTRWLNRAWHKGKEDFPTLDSGNETPFLWADKYLSKEFEDFWYSKDFGYAEPHLESIPFIEERTGRHEPKYRSYRIESDKENLLEKTVAATQNTEGYASPLPLKEDGKSYLVVKAFASYMMAHSDDAKQNYMMANDLCERFEVSKMIEFSLLIRQTELYFDFLKNKYGIIKIAKGFPLRNHFNGRLFEVDVDIFGENTVTPLRDEAKGIMDEGNPDASGKGGFFLIQNSDFTGDVNSNKKEALRYATLLLLANKTVEQLYKPKTIRCFVHFILQGKMIEITFK
jgi:ATP-dependent helicase/nuclease subunit A